MEAQNTPNSPNNSKNRNTATGTPIPDFKLYYRAIAEKQNGIGPKPDILINKTELRTKTQTQVYTATDIWFLAKVSKICIIEKMSSLTNGVVNKKISTYTV